MHRHRTVGQELKQMCEGVKGQSLIPAQDAFNSPHGKKLTKLWSFVAVV